MEEAKMGFDKYEETEDIIDWDWIQSQPAWYRKEVLSGKKKPKYKKRIREERRNAEKKYRD